MITDEHQKKWRSSSILTEVETSQNEKATKLTELLHKRLGHTNTTRIRYMLKHQTTADILGEKITDIPSCKSCIEGKLKKRKFDKISFQIIITF
jgi:hypothetical protein